MRPVVARIIVRAGTIGGYIHADVCRETLLSKAIPLSPPITLVSPAHSHEPLMHYRGGDSS